MTKTDTKNIRTVLALCLRSARLRAIGVEGPLADPNSDTNVRIRLGISIAELEIRRALRKLDPAFDDDADDVFRKESGAFDKALGG